MQVASADRRESSPAWPDQVNHASSAEIAFERPCRLHLNLCPCGVGNGCELAMEVIHVDDHLSGNRCRASRHGWRIEAVMGRPLLLNPSHLQADHFASHPE